MGLARAPSLRNTVASLAVLAVVALIAFGIPYFNRTLPADRPVVAGLPYDVGGGVTVVPPPGSYVDVTGTRPAADRGTALFVLNGVRVAVVVTPYLGSLDAAAARLSGKIVKSTGGQVAAGGQEIRTAQGIAGRRGAYSSPGRVGGYAVFVAHELSVEVTASEPQGDLSALAPMLRSSIETVVFGPAP